MRAFSGRSHYDTIAQDTIAMAVNDLVTVGATPLSTHAYWSAGSSAWFADKERMQDLVRGWQAACDVCGMAWGGGETPALGGVVEAERIDLAASCVGIVKGRDRLMLGERLQAGDAIVLLASSGIHANGISLARTLAERLPDGYRTRLADGRTFGEALLDPTVLYAPVIEALFAAGVRPHYAVNVTGHGWRKLMRHPAELKYMIRRMPPVPPVLAVPASARRHERARRLRHVNMGAGFALFVARADVAATIAVAERAGARGLACRRRRSGREEPRHRAARPRVRRERPALARLSASASAAPESIAGSVHEPALRHASAEPVQQRTGFLLEPDACNNARAC